VFETRWNEETTYSEGAIVSGPGVGEAIGEMERTEGTRRHPWCEGEYLPTEPRPSGTAHRPALKVTDNSVGLRKTCRFPPHVSTIRPRKKGWRDPMAVEADSSGPSVLTAYDG
jgi:hypothetical protein